MAEGQMWMASLRRLHASESRVEQIAEVILECRAKVPGAWEFNCNDERNEAIAYAVAAARATHGLDDAQADYLKDILRDAIPRVAE